MHTNTQIEKRDN